MADGFHVGIHGIDALSAALRDVERRTDRATMWTVREVGRQVKREAMRTSPVYKGADAAKRPRKGESIDSMSQPVTGLFKYSIHSRRRLRREGPAWVNAVAVRGQRVHLYSQRVEARYGVIARAYRTVAPEIRLIAERAWARSTRGRR